MISYDICLSLIFILTFIAFVFCQPCPHCTLKVCIFLPFFIHLANIYPVNSFYLPSTGAGYQSIKVGTLYFLYISLSPPAQHKQGKIVTRRQEHVLLIEASTRFYGSKETISNLEFVRYCLNALFPRDAKENSKHRLGFFSVGMFQRRV